MPSFSNARAFGRTSTCRYSSGQDGPYTSSQSNHEHPRQNVCFRRETAPAKEASPFVLLYTPLELLWKSKLILGGGVQPTPSFPQAESPTCTQWSRGLPLSGVVGQRGGGSVGVVSRECLPLIRPLPSQHSPMSVPCLPMRFKFRWEPPAR